GKFVIPLAFFSAAGRSCHLSTGNSLNRTETSPFPAGELSLYERVSPNRRPPDHLEPGWRKSGSNAGTSAPFIVRRSPAARNWRYIRPSSPSSLRASADGLRYSTLSHCSSL